ncbi:aminotransferase-like domain-containing protein [Nocardiopsis trehalosi]|jgi:DNA-binding transcriptional MocR family regulator|uniref:aminotransferase-like domain-containing protein n=1 Tax=Nocardiopsis trehalosi TaxID=109329 RepID=UPI0008295F40|nr:PLP-dependent aminotransferase family protein [Nocardiopsis trehalosi]
MNKPMSAPALAGLLGRWAAGRGPLYRLLAARLRALVEEGLLAPDTRLPPDRALAASLAVGRGTVVAAYDLLRDEGRLVRRQGSGTRVAPAALPERPAAAGAAEGPFFLSMLERPPGALVLTCAAPDAPPPELRAAFGRAAAALAGLADDIGYHPAGHPSLRAALARRFTERGLPTGPEQILVTNGAQQALALLVRCFVAAGDTVLAEAPTYPGALGVFGDAAARVTTVPVGPEGVDAAECVRAMAERRPALTYLVPSFQNPTGTVLPPLQRRRIVRAAAEHGLLLVEDETLAELGFAGEVPPPMAGHPGGDRVVTVGSLSKVVWGGLRVGWIRAPRPVVDRLARTKALADLGGDVTGQLAAHHLLGSPDWAVLRDRRRAELAARHGRLRAELARRLPDWTATRAEGGQTVWVRLPRGDAASFAQVALRRGVALLPGGVLAPGGAGDDRLRVPFLAPEETLVRAVELLAAAWGEYTGARSGAAPVSAMVV